MSEIEKGKVSVIVPIYNDEKYIRLCVDSIIAQTYNKLEIILIDDASKDMSLEICQEYALQDNRVKVLHNDMNCGVSVSRELGYQQATGEWICFIDHDDYMCPWAIECLLNAADEMADIIAGKYKSILDGYFGKYMCVENDKADVLVLEHDIAVDTLGSFGKYEVPECLWGKIYRKSLFEKINFGKYREKFSKIFFEDILLTSALIKACSHLKIVDQYIYIHQVINNSVSLKLTELEINLQTARAADIVIGRLDEIYSRNAYAKTIESFLLVFSKNWYIVWRYYDKDPVLLNEMEGLFDKYYKTYKEFDRDKKRFVNNICISLFNANKVLFCIIVCQLWFQYFSKIKRYFVAKHSMQY